MRFSELGLVPELVRAVEQAGYEHPTPIQRDALPPVLSGRDVLACAQTGTGKTAAFALPILQRLSETVEEEPQIRALVLAPTRELAAQIGASFRTYGRHLELWHAVIFGGVKDGPQIAELRQGVDTVIATPGRLLDLMGRGEVDLSGVRHFVLDEADRMLDMGFLPDIKRIAAKVPKVRQTLLFSATMPDAIRSLAGTLLTDPLQISVAPVSSAADTVDQRVYLVDKPNKAKLLLGLLRAGEMARVLVFSRTKHGANKIVKILERSGTAARAIHGNKSQNARTAALEAFRKGDVGVLVATDLAARGLDVDGITHVINFDLPETPETYVHRIGRTGRAGAVGVALSLCDTEERPYLANIERLVRRRIHCEADHDFAPTGEGRPSAERAGRAQVRGQYRRPRRSTGRRAASARA